MIALVVAGLATVLLVFQDDELQRLVQLGASRNAVGKLRREPVLLSVLRRRADDARNDSDIAQLVLRLATSDLVGGQYNCRVEAHLRDGLTADALAAGKASWSVAAATTVFGVVTVVPAHGHEVANANLQRIVAHLMDKASVDHTEYVASRHAHTEYGEYNGEAIQGWDPKRKHDWPAGTRSPAVCASR